MEKKICNALKYVPIHWSDMNLFLGFRSKSRMEVPAVCHLWRGDTFVDSRPQVNWSKLTGKQLKSWSTSLNVVILQAQQTLLNFPMYIMIIC